MNESLKSVLVLGTGQTLKRNTLPASAPPKPNRSLNPASKGSVIDQSDSETEPVLPPSAESDQASSSTADDKVQPEGQTNEGAIAQEETVKKSEDVLVNGHDTAVAGDTSTQKGGSKEREPTPPASSQGGNKKREPTPPASSQGGNKEREPTPPASSQKEGTKKRKPTPPASSQKGGSKEREPTPALDPAEQTDKSKVKGQALLSPGDETKDTNKKLANGYVETEPAGTGITQNGLSPESHVQSNNRESHSESHHKQDNRSHDTTQNNDNETPNQDNRSHDKLQSNHKEDDKSHDKAQSSHNQENRSHDKPPNESQNGSTTEETLVESVEPKRKPESSETSYGGGGYDYVFEAARSLGKGDLNLNHALPDSVYCECTHL